MCGESVNWEVIRNESIERGYQKREDPGHILIRNFLESRIMDGKSEGKEWK